MSTKNRMFSALLLKIYCCIHVSIICCLLFEFKCGLLSPVSCTDRTIHAFPNKTWRPLGPPFRMHVRCGGPSAPKYFLLSFFSTLHPLGYALASCNIVCISVSVLVRQQLHCYACTCMQQNFRFIATSLRWLRRLDWCMQCRTPATASLGTRSAVLLHVQYSESVCSVLTGYDCFLWDCS